MQHCIINRSDFASLLGEVDGRRQRIPETVRHGKPQDSPAKGELCVCWDDQPSQEDALPVLIVLSDTELNDFLAWAVAFLPMFRPLTCFFRVIPWTIFTLVDERKPIEHLENATALIGAILGETLTNATSRGFMDSLPLTAFESTYSWVMSRSLIVGLNPKILSYVSEAWHTMRDLTAQTNRKIPPESLERVWSVLLRLTNKDQDLRVKTSRDHPLGLIEEACLEIQHSGRISDSNWDRLSEGRISNAAIAESMSSTKERRVETFESVVRNLLRTQSGEFSTSFLVGYLTSLVSGGSLEHSQLIMPLQGELPSAMLWYGVCAGLLPDNRILTDNSHLGLRIVRLLRRNETLMSPTYADISLAELEVVLRGEPRSRGFRQSQSSSLRVELAPMVTAVMRSPSRTSANNDQLGLFGSEDRPVSLEADRLRELVVAMRGTLSIAESLLGSKEAPSGVASSQYRGKRRR
jgi:hypothetical protein